MVTLFFLYVYRGQQCTFFSDNDMSDVENLDGSAFTGPQGLKMAKIESFLHMSQNEIRAYGFLN